MDEVELLSPAGDFETALAAFEAGADAVYCGLGDFSARAFAVNFSLADLKNLVRAAHARGKRVYVTFNTLVDETDLEQAVVRLADLADVGPDALIVQDLGVARLVRRHFPELALHASTQLVAHNLEGVLALKELGFSRVVLARELSLDEIASIAKRCGGLELECFIHGALCYSISGLCLFSAMEKGRSGNRGKCAYCCRLGIGAKAKGEQTNSHHCSPSPSFFTSYPFSMKDLRLGEDVRKLVRAGVASLKIEGRMKSALYVASVTRYYRQILGGEAGCLPDVGAASCRTTSRPVTVADLETVFSRRTTELYLNGATSSPIDPTSLGHLGSPIGTVKRVTRDREGRAWVRFHTARALERHDGLQFAAPFEGVKPFGFGISEMRTALSRATVFEVAAGTDVEVLLPEGEGRAFSDAGGGPRLQGDAAGVESVRPGVTVYCSMSNAVKRMFPVPSFRPSDYPGERTLDVTVTLEPDRIVAEASFVSAALSGAFAPAKDPTRTREAVEKAFAKLGGTDYRLGKLTVNDPEKLFAPASFLNDLRRDLVGKLDAARAKARAAKIAAALADSCVGVRRESGDASGIRETGDASGGASLRIRAGQSVPAGDWDEIVVAIDRSGFDPFCACPHAQQGIGPDSADMCAGDRRTTDEGGALLSAFQRDRLRLALPVYTKEPDFNALRTCVKRLLRAGYAKWEASDLATLRMLRALGVTDLTADWTLYAFNSQALAALAELGVTRFVASPENGAENLAFLNESGYEVACLVQQSTPLFISLTQPELPCPERPRGSAALPGKAVSCGDFRIFARDGLWITTKRMPRTFAAPKGAATRVDLSWDPPMEGVDA